MGSRKMVVLVGPKKTKSTLLDIESKAAKYLLAVGWKIDSQVIPDDSGNESHNINHSRPQRVPGDIPEAQTAVKRTLQHENLQELNASLSQRAIEVLIDASLDSPDALLRASPQKLLELGLTRAELRKIRRLIRIPAQPEHNEDEMPYPNERANTKQE